MSQALWEQVVGHQPVLQRLVGECAHGRAAQGYLLTGPALVGKTLIARGLAQRLNCSGAAPPCGDCEGCRRVALGSPSHLLVIEPEEQGGSSVVKQRMHKVETIRRLLSETVLATTSGVVRVIVLRTAEVMHEVAAEAMLKTLEEPPTRTVFVLTSEQPDALRPTIRSRLRRLDCSAVPAQPIQEWLMAQHGVAAEAATVAAATCAGRPGLAWQFVTDAALLSLRQELLQQLGGLGERPPVTAIRLAARWCSDEGGGAGRRVEALLDWTEWWYRDAYVRCTTGERGHIVNVDAAAAVERFAARRGAAELRDGLTALQEARLALRRNVNAQLLLEVLWLRLARGARAGAAR
ncbi:MAG: DNA polymerase III subunit [Fimbriimonadaceae bacterium]|nr:DNA polymerase III subunit [Fimbriimonadaceae bacterium]